MQLLVFRKTFSSFNDYVHAKKKQNKSSKTFKIQPLIKGNSYHFSNKFIKKIYLHIKHNYRGHNFVRHIPFKIDPKKHKT